MISMIPNRINHAMST